MARRNALKAVNFVLAALLVTRASEAVTRPVTRATQTRIWWHWTSTWSRPWRCQKSTDASRKKAVAELRSDVQVGILAI